MSISTPKLELPMQWETKLDELPIQKKDDLKAEKILKKVGVVKV